MEFGNHLEKGDVSCFDNLMEELIKKLKKPHPKKRKRFFGTIFTCAILFTFSLLCYSKVRKELAALLVVQYT